MARWNGNQTLAIDVCATSSDLPPCNLESFRKHRAHGDAASGWRPCELWRPQATGGHRSFPVTSTCPPHPGVGGGQSTRRSLAGPVVGRVTAGCKGQYPFYRWKSLVHLELFSQVTRGRWSSRSSPSWRRSTTVQVTRWSGCNVGTHRFWRSASFL